MASGTDKRKVARARTEAKITGDQTGIFSANVKSKSRDVISCKGAGTSPICIAGPGQGGEQEALGRGVIYVTYGLYLQSGTTSASTPESDKERSAERKRKLRKREIERERRRKSERNRRLEEREESKYTAWERIYGSCVYVRSRVRVSRRRSAGGATGADKNVLRTLDITGSNVTRSRRERACLLRSAAQRRGAEKREEGR